LDDSQAVNALVRRCVAGDAAAWQEIVQQYNRRIYNICYRFSGSTDDAADLTQEVFIKIYRTLGTFDGTKAAERQEDGAPGRSTTAKKAGSATR
jgi:RNA polymerase sigma-70 factor (ECF subfamily)